MPSDPAPPAADSQSAVWSAVTDHLEAFARAWDGPDVPPDPAGFVPPAPPAVRRLVLIEVVKLDLDHRLQRGLGRPLEDYLRAFPELAAGGPPCDLLYEDFYLRRRAGEAVEAVEYYRRFPDQAADLGRLLADTATPVASTAVRAVRQPVGVAAGDRLDDFDLLTVVGKGQFATVYLARQRGMQRLVALKVSATRGAEAQTLAQLDHPHVVRVYDQRTLADRGLHLVYMPYLPGGTLADVVDRARAVTPAGRSGRTLLEAVDASLTHRGEVPPTGSTARQGWAGRTWPAAVCALGAKLAAALAYAHRHGVLHRDVKPANVLLTADGEPLLADFNVGCCSKVDGAGPTAFFGGSLGYMAVEHLEAFDPRHPREPDSLDGKSDVFSLAVTLWELLTGTRPFEAAGLAGSWAETLAVLAAARRAGLTAEAAAAMPEGDVPGLRDVLVRCLDPDPDRRPAADEMARELTLCLRPAARALVRPGPGGWRAFVRRHPLLTVYPVALVPNFLSSLVNIEYNRDQIIVLWTTEETFQILMAVVNGVFFPVGLLLFGMAVWPVAQGLQRVRDGEHPPADDLARWRRQALRLGAVGGGLCMFCWVTAGGVWPAVLRAVAGPPPQGPVAYVHFLASLAVCGLIAATYPYFLLTFLAVRAMYPALLGPAGPDPADGPALDRVGRDLGRFRVAAAAVPFAAVGLLVWRGVPSPFAVAVLSLTGLAGSLLAFVLEGRTRADLAALAANPADDRG